MSDDFPVRESIRLPGYDYSQNGYYFVTICTQNTENLFGGIRNGIMILNDVGKIVDHWVNETKYKFSNIKMDICQIMPNHIHLIMIIVGAGFSRPTKTPVKLPTLGQIIAYFKYQSTIEINNIYIESGAKTAPLQNESGGKTPPLHFKHIFQRNYYEHIIRSEREFKQIHFYIQTNPQNWDTDKNNMNWANLDSPLQK
jgi:putative transposase